MDRVHPVAGWGERTYCTNLDLSSHQRPKARQTGLSLGLVFVTIFLGRWLLVFAGVVFAVVTCGGGGRVFSFFVLVQVLQRSGAGPANCHGARGARTRAAADAVNVWLQSRSLPARGRVGLEVHRCLCIIDAGIVFISTVMGLMRESSLFLRTPPSAIAKEEAAKTVGLRLPSMSTSYVFACVV